MAARVPRLAELNLQTVCAEAGALSHKTEEDERGWDFLIEFPFKPFNGPADMRPSPSVAYVQVKSTTTSSSSCRIKLSNALLAAQSSQPWFLVLFVSRPNKPTKIYAVHFWEALIREALKEGRRAEVENRPLNQTKFKVQFSQKDDKTNNLIQWMQMEIEQVKPDYNQAKSKISKSAGFEESTGTVLMTIEAKNKHELAWNFLGLGEGLRVSRLNFTPSRFGIASSKPDHVAKDGIVHITPEPFGIAELRFRTSANSEVINLPATIYAAPPNIGFNGQCFRFSAPCAEIVVNQTDPSACTAEIDLSGEQTLETLEQFSTLKCWLQDGPIELQIWSDAGRVSMGTLRSSIPPEAQWSDMARAFKLLRSIASPADQQKIRIELKALFVASGLKTFLDISNAGAVRIEFEPTEGLPEKFTSLLYWFSTNLGGYEFYSLVERSVLQDIRIDDGERRQLTTGPARVTEKYVLPLNEKVNRAQFQADFDRRIASLVELGEAPCGMGEVREFIERGRF
jgi:hypothetical protein